MAAKTKAPPHRWQFQPRFRRHSFGWRSQPAVLRVGQAVAEIRKEGRRDPLMGAEGAVILLERLCPALEQVDSSSGAIGNAVDRAVSELVSLIAGAPATATVQEAWLERLWAAQQADQIPYLEALGEHWGELCASPERASGWADRLLDRTQAALVPGRRSPFYQGSEACLSALFSAGRHQEIVDLVGPEGIWAYRRWKVRALVAMGRRAEGIRYAEACRGPGSSDAEIDLACEEILLSSGMEEEAYRRYGLRAHQRSTYLATFRAVVGRYPSRNPREVLADLVQSTPGHEGKWFTAARRAASPAEALALARQSPCDPRTLTRAARDWAREHPAEAVEAGLLALHWLVRGFGFEITGADVLAAYESALAAAKESEGEGQVRDRVRRILAEQGHPVSIQAILGPYLDGRLLMPPDEARSRPAPESTHLI